MLMEEPAKFGNFSLLTAGPFFRTRRISDNTCVISNASNNQRATNGSCSTTASATTEFVQ
jgi:hypothetical protein